MKVDDDFNLEWTNIVGNYPGGTNQFEGLGPGDWTKVYTECWGMTKTYSSEGEQDGYAMTCGSGVEPPATGVTDPRTAWRTLTMATDLEGNRKWSR